MDPQVKSALTSVLLGLMTSVATWASTIGIIPDTEKTALANVLVSVVLWAVAAAIAWYKTRQVSPKALITAVNTGDNGVKVVAAHEPVPIVTEPQKGVK